MYNISTNIMWKDWQTSNTCSLCNNKVWNYNYFDFINSGISSCAAASSIQVTPLCWGYKKMLLKPLKIEIVKLKFLLNVKTLWGREAFCRKHCTLRLKHLKNSSTTFITVGRFFKALELEVNQQKVQQYSLQQYSSCKTEITAKSLVRLHKIN